jgi:hypothetical protein
MEARILLGMPTTKNVNFETVASMMGLGSRFITHTTIIDCCLVYKARQQIVEEALKANCTHVFFMDSDMVIKYGDIDKLLEHNLDIASMMAFKRTPPYNPCFYKDKVGNEYIPWYEWNKDSLIECAGIGLACALIKTKVFANIGLDCFIPRDNGEDISFCEKAIESGYNIWVDTSLCAGHVSQEIIGSAHYLAYRDNKRGLVENE